MPKPNKGETSAQFKVRNAAYHRQRRIRKRSEIAGNGVPPQVPEVQAIVVQQESIPQPVVTMYQRLGDLVRNKRSEPREIQSMAAAFRSTASALSTLQALATHSEVRQIVELVDPEISTETRDKLEAILEAIDRRAGLVA